MARGSWATYLIILLLGLGPGLAMAAPEPILVGATVSREGEFVATSAMVEAGLKLWERDVNAQGGILGRPVRLVLLDDHSDPGMVGALYRRLILEERVDLLMAPYGTPLSLAASQVTDPLGRVMMVEAASGSQIWAPGRRFVFGIYAAAPRYFLGVMDLLARQGLTRAGMIYEDSPFHRDTRDGALNWAKRFGVKLPPPLAFQPGGQGLVPALEKLNQPGTALLVSAYVPEGMTVLRHLGIRPRQPAALAMTISPAMADFAERVGPWAEGVLAPSQWEPRLTLPFPGTARFVTDFRQAWGQDPSYHAASAFAAGQMLARAVNLAGGLDQERIRRHLLAMDTVSIAGRFKLAPNGLQIGHSPLVVQWQGGRKEIVYPPHLATAPVRFHGRP